MKKRDCHHCGKSPVKGDKRWLNGVHAYWHDDCYAAAKQKIIEKTFPPRKRKKYER